ncbi:MAG: helix-turn-helix domain-containing protein [Patescibacteria group bacterium]
MDIETLQKFGLSQKEALIYLALLELGTGSVTQAAVRANINRTTAYDILEALVNYGLVSYVKEENKKRYAAGDPELLVSFLERKSREYQDKAAEAKRLLPELKGVYNGAPQKPKVKYYDGEDGIISMYEDSLTAKSQILSWLNTEQTAEFGADYFEKYYERRTQKGITIRAIINDVPVSHEIKKRDIAELRQTRIISKEKMNIVPECYIYDDKVSFMSLKEKFGVIIESKDIAEAQRKLYELAWSEASDLAKK